MEFQRFGRGVLHPGEMALSAFVLDLVQKSLWSGIDAWI